MTRSSAEIEREVERQRGRVEQSLTSLKDRLSVGQLVDEAGRYVHADDLENAFRNVGRQARDNPLALGLVGAGVAWLMSGNGVRGSDSSHHSRGFYHQTHLAEGDDALADGATLAGDGRRVRGASAGESSIGSKLGRAASAASDALHSTSDTLRSAYDSGRRGMHDMRDRVSGSGNAAYGDGRHHGGRMRHMVSDALENEPLIVGACALALGIAIGAALPSTRSEDRWFGEERDDLMDKARDAASSAKDQAVGTAKETYRTVKKAASDGGHETGEGNKTIAEEVRERRQEDGGPGTL